MSSTYDSIDAEVDKSSSCNGSGGQKILFSVDWNGTLNKWYDFDNPIILYEIMKFLKQNHIPGTPIWF